MGALSTVAAEFLPQLSFDFQKSKILLALSRGIVADYEAALAERPLEPRADTGETETVLVWRDPSQQVLYRILIILEHSRSPKQPRERHLVRSAACSRFGDADEGVAQRAADFLARWFGAGLITGINILPN